MLMFIGIPRCALTPDFFVKHALVSVVVDGVIEAIPQLVAVIVLVLFSFVLFGIIGVQLFSGLFHARCRLTPYPVIVVATNKATGIFDMFDYLET